MRGSSHNRRENSPRWEAVERLEAGQSQVEVPERLQVAPKVVYRLWNQFQTTGNIIRRSSQDRLGATTPTQESSLTYARRQIQTTPTELSRDFAVASGTRISRSTIYRHIAESALFAWRAVVSP